MNKIRKWVMLITKPRFITLLIGTSFTFGILLLSLLFPDNIAFLSFHPHPFWISIFVVSLRSRIRDSLINALVCAVIYSIFLVQNTPFFMFSTITIFSLFKEPVLFLIVATVVGESSERLVHQRQRFLTHMRSRVRRMATLQERHTAVTEALKLLSDRITGQNTDVLDLFNEVSLSKRLTYDDMLVAMLNTITKHLKAKVCMYHEVHGQHVYRRYSHENGRIHRFNEPTTTDFLFNEALRTKRISHLAYAMQEADFKHYHGTHLIVGPVLNSSKVPIGLVSIDEIDFINYNPSTLKLLQCILTWWGTVLEERQTMDDLHRKSIYNEELGVYSFAYFGQRLEEEFTRAKNHKVPLTIARVHLDDPENILPNKRMELLSTVSTILGSFLSALDLVATDHILGSFVLLFPGRSEEESQKNMGITLEEVARYQLKPYEHHPDTQLSISSSIVQLSDHISSEDLLAQLDTFEKVKA
ncbi:hypothetical protein HOH87_03580 [bacterium]|jgi:hypothetical protein|nr:hypothetical protein [bacterium]